MEERRRQGTLLEVRAADEGQVIINARCRVETCGGHRVVSVSGVAMAHFAVSDRIGEAYAMVNLVEQGWATQREVARSFGCSVRTVRRYQRRHEEGGIAALGRRPGYPRGRPRLATSRRKLVERWIAEGVAKREIARRLKVSAKAVRSLLRRLGWKPPRPAEQLRLDIEGGDSNVSGSAGAPCAGGRSVGSASEDTSRPRAGGGDPNVSGSAGEAAWTMDFDPADRFIDRLLASKGLLDDAAPLFRSGRDVHQAGVLLAIPALVESGVFDIARDIYGSIGPAFYGLRTTVATFLLMALLRIKRPEGIKEVPPEHLGRVLGLDRAPEVKTLRRKLVRLAAFNRAGDFGRALAERRVSTRGHALGFLYVDGHVRVYHGKRQLPKTHVARMRLSMPATTDYWVNDTGGDPVFLVPVEANQGLIRTMPAVLDEVRRLVGDRRVTVVFDRGGWSPKFFRRLLASGFDVLTYRKGRSRKVPLRRFQWHEAFLDGRRVRYNLADQNILLDRGRLKLRQVTRSSEDGHQTPIVTSRFDLPAIEVAYRMFERWRQENFFKYLRGEYALDALLDYGVEPADPQREVPNPERKKLDAEIKKARVRLAQLGAEYGFEAWANEEQVRSTMRGFKIANAPLSRRIREALERVATLTNRRASTPRRIPVREVTPAEVIKLDTERKLLTDLLKMVAYQAESDLVRLISPHYLRAEDEGRTLIQNALSSRGDIELGKGELRTVLDPLNSPHRTQALIALCDHLNETRTCFPGSNLRLVFEVKPPPPVSMAFPGPRAS